MRLRIQTWKEFRWDNPRYLHDKVLHAHYTPSPGFLTAQKTKSIILLRAPLESLRSIITLEAKSREITPEDHHFACEHYCSRIDDMLLIAETLDSGAYIFINSSEIVTDTESTLKRIESFLELSAPLSNTYQLFSDTGKDLKGDSSKSIHAGKILHLNGDRYNHIRIDNNQLERATDAYKKAMAVLAG